ncbi:MAG: hypothetical protein U1E15_00905 [Hyphomicrobiales bacterium]
MKRSALMCLAALLTGCGESGPKDYVSIAGGGLVFNYRYSQATMLIIAKQVSPMPADGTLVAEFTLPGGAGIDRQTSKVMPGKLTYKLESSVLHGIRKGEPLKVLLTLQGPKGEVLDREETVFTSDTDQSTLPSKPLVQPDKPNYVPQLENLN